MAKSRLIGILVGASVTVLLTSCNSVVVRQAELMSATPRPWAPLARPVVAASPLFEPPPVLPASYNAIDREPFLNSADEEQRRLALASLRRDLERGWKQDSDQLLDQYNAQQVESWKQTQDLIAQQSEPLVLDEVLALNLSEDSSLSPELHKALLGTKSDLPVTLNAQVLRYVNYFRGRGRKTLRESLRRAGSYRPMISRILAEEGVPQDLIYVVQAESGFRAQAKSPKAAGGMWQFVSWRGREYGLTQHRGVDERFDPEKATRAAARHLGDLYAELGNWYLAMAAYNCGPMCVQRAVERTGYADYWELVRRGALPKETSNYVPVIVAMLLMDKNAETFRLDDILPEDPIAYDTVETNSRIGLSLIADVTGAPLSEIKSLNPALLAQSTPDVAYSLRIPKDTTEPFERGIALIPEARRESWRRHTILDGETLAQIASHYKVKPQEITAVNQLEGEALPAPGSGLTIPVPYRPPVAARPALAKRAAKPAPKATRPAYHLVRYRVKTGDSLVSIAERYEVTPAKLQQWNRLSGVKLRPGQVLTVHAPSSVSTASAAPASRGLVPRPAGGPAAHGPAVASSTAPAGKTTD